MSHSHLSLPSISHVLEAGHGFIPRNPSAIRLDQPDASLTTTSVPSSLSPSPSLDMMKNIDSYDNALEDGQDEDFSPSDEFPNLASDEAATRTIFKEHTTANSADVQGENQGQGLRNPFKHRLSVLLSAVRKLLPVKIAEALLRKAVQH